MGKRKRQPHAPRPAARKGVQAAAARLVWVPGALARMLLALCGVYGAVFGLAQGFALETDVRLVAAFCVGAVAVCLLVPAAVRLVRRGRPQRRLWARKGCLFSAWAAVLALWAWGVPPVCLGFRLLCARITQEYRLYYAWVPQWYPEMLSAGAAQARGLYTAFLCWLALLAAGLVCMALAAKKRALWGILATAVPFCLPLVITRVAGPGPVCAMLAFWLALVFSQPFHAANMARGARAALLALPLALCGVAALYLPLDKTDYSRPAWALNPWRTVLEWSAQLPGQWGAGAQAALDDMPTALVRVGSHGAQNLTVSGPRYTGRTMLQVESDVDGFFYLRGASAGAYTGQSWQAGRVLRMAGGQTASPLTYAARFAGSAARHTMQLRPVGDSTGLCYLPMYPAGLQRAEFEGDIYARLTGEQAQVAFVAQPGSSAPVALQAEEQAYAAAVREVYTALPEETRSALLALAAQAGIRPGAGAEALARQVEAYVEQAAVYDIDAPRQPAQEDFAVYFLAQGKRGWCMHFATAAACMLRALDVPARYVSGYVCTVEGGAADVPDYAAHAWVEYYVQGKGWLMLDATPPAGVAQGGQEAFASSGAESAGSTQPQATPAPQSGSLLASQPQSSGEQAPASTGEDGFGLGASGGQGANSPGLPQAVRQALARTAWALGLCIAACLLAAARRSLCQRRRRALFAQNTCRAALGIYRYALRLNGGAPLPEHIVLLAEKAKFSRSGLSAQEMDALCNFAAARARQRREQAALPRRLWDEWALCLY